MERSRRDRDKVARGATLFSKETKNKSSKKRNIKLKAGITIATKSIPDTQNEDEVIKRLDNAGIEVHSYKKRYLLRRIKARMSKLNLETYGSYMDHLLRQPMEIRELQESLSINVTRFFRNRDTFETIRDEVLPLIIEEAKKKGRNEIKIWSAGCAVGAEPYSIAMIASDIAPPSMTVRVFASDVKEELLGIARFATYTDQYVAEMHPFEITKYFNINEHGEYIVKPNIRRMVSFTKVDLMKDPYPSGLDLILCRNVLIYIDREAQNNIISNFFKSLKESGMLILGRTETLFVDWRKHIEIISTKHRVYQKISNTPDKLPTLDFGGSGSRTKIFSKSASNSHQKRLSDLKNFRKVYEDRKRAWEKRFEESEKRSKEIRREAKRGAFSRNRVSVGKTREIIKTWKPNIEKVKPTVRSQSFTHKSSRTGILSSFRDTLKKSPTPLRPQEMNFKKLVGNKSPEEVYKELKRIRKKREF